MSGRVLIVGCGYLGSRVACRLRELGMDVHATTRSLERARLLSDQGISPLVFDVTEPDSAAPWPSFDVVLHAVGFDRRAGHSMRRVYVDGLRAVLDRLEGKAGRFVLASSTSVYGQEGGEWVDEHSETAPRSDSGRVVLEAEHTALERASLGAVPVVILRFSGLYGPGRIIRRDLVATGRPIPSRPDTFLNLIQIEDAAQAAVAALTRPGVEAGVYIATDDRPVRRREFYGRLAGLLGAPEPIFEPPVEPDDSDRRLKNGRMKAGLGVVLRFPDISTGLPASVADQSPPAAGSM